MKRKILMVLLLCLFMFGLNSDVIAKKAKMTKEEKQAAKLAKKEEKLEGYLGTNSNWKPTVLTNIQRGMTCDQAKQVFKGLNCSGPSPFKNVPGGLGTISDYKFYFQKGRLFSVTIIFGVRLLDQKSFTVALMNVLQRKWGPIRDAQNIEWKDYDYKTIRLKFNKGHWELVFQMPSLNPGDVDVSTFNEEMLRSEVKKYLGGPESCLPAYFTQFRYQMPWEEVQKIFPDLVYDHSKSINSCIVSVKGHPLAAGLKLRFNSGLLEHVTTLFHWQIPRELFKSITFEVMKEKYGAQIKDEDAVKDRITVFSRDCGILSRAWSTNRWEIGFTMPKKIGGKTSGGAK